MPYHVIPRTDLSFRDLARMARRGRPILKTPHVGNMYPNNLAVGKLGIPLLLSDQTIGQKDQNFHPHLVVCGGKNEVVSDSTLLTSHAKVTLQPKLHSQRFVPGARLADCHVTALRDALPHAHVETTSKRAYTHADVMVPALMHLTEWQPRRWARYVDADGRVIRRILQDQDQLRREGIHGADEKNGAGWIIPNVWNILLDGILAISVYGSSEVFHLSGPDMIVYIKSYTEDLHAAYDRLRERFHAFKMPEEFHFNIIPAADMRFVVAERHRRSLDELVDAHLDVQRFRKTCADELVNLSGEAKYQRIAELDKTRPKFQLRLREASRACPQVFYEIAHANYLSQYDLLDGEELYIHPWGVETPLRQVIDAVRSFERACKSS